MTSNILQTTVVFILLISYPVFVDGGCDTGWLFDSGFCYFYSTEALVYADASTACEASYASLVYIDNEEENLFIHRNGPEPNSWSYWIGYKLVYGTIWRWTATGSAGTYFKWDIGEPDFEGGCARMTPYVSGVWRDWECDRTLPYICKKYADCDPPLPMPTDNGSPLGTHKIFYNDEDITELGIFPQGSQVTYTCSDGAEFVDGSLQKSALCDFTSSWKPSLVGSDECQWKSCLSPPLFTEHVLTNATVDTKNFGTTLYYKCEDGYWFDQFSLGLTRYISCQTTKEWAGDTIVECTKVYCVRPITGNALASTVSNSFGVDATYTCNPGYKYDDNTTVKTFTCTDTGWDPPPAACEQMMCPEFTVTNAAPDTEARSVFTTRTYYCNSGMRYPDTTIRKSMYCQLDETWDKPITEACERKKCERAPPNASETYQHDYNPSQTYVYQDTLNYSCIYPEWYFADGLTYKLIECNEYGEWPAVVPDCLGEKIEVKDDITHPPTEAEGGGTITTVAMLIIGIQFGVIVVLDLATIKKHIDVMKSNICPPEAEDEEDVPTEPEVPKSNAPLKIVDV